MKEFISRLKRKLDNRIREFVKRHTSFKDTFAGLEIGNVLVALSTICLMGVGSLPFSIPVIVFLSLILVVLGVVGKYIDEVSDDNERLILYEEHLKELLHRRTVDEDSSSSYSHTSSHDSVQSANNQAEGRTARDNDSREHRIKRARCSSRETA